MGLNPLDWYGTDFLVLYGALLVAAIVGSFRIAASLRPEGRRGKLTEADDLAVLHLGKERFAEVVAARLLQRGALKVEKSRLLRLSSSGGGALENEVLRAGDTISWKALRRVTDTGAARIEQGLVRRGLLMERGEWLQLGFYAVLPLLALMAFGVIKVFVGMSRDRPVEFLLFLLFVTACVVGARWSGTDKRTKAGLEARDNALDSFTRLSQAHTKEETGMAVALFGTSILATSELGDFHRMRTAGSSDSGGGSGSDSGGGGGGGGGCGGCGS